MSTKSKRRSARRARPENTQPFIDHDAPETREALGAIAGALLNAITLGTVNVDDGPRSHPQP